MLNELQVFVAVAEEGSLSTASTRLGMTLATVSRRISHLEDHIGHKLMHRGPRGITLTAEGESYLNECGDLVHRLEHRLTNLDESLNSDAGRLKVLAPTNLAQGPLNPFWREFMADFPGVDLSVDLSNRFADLVQSQADIAIRVGPQPDSSLIQKRLGYVPTVLVAGADMSHLPSRPEELASMPTVANPFFGDWQLTHHDGEQLTLKKHHPLSVDDLLLAIHFAQCKPAITLCPLSAVQGELAKGNLQPVLPDWHGIHRTLYLVWPFRRAMSKRAKIFAQRLEAFLLQQSWFRTD